MPARAGGQHDGAVVGDVDRVSPKHGPALDPDRLRRHTLLYAAAMGVVWLLYVPALIRTRISSGATEHSDPRIKEDESLRAPLQMLSNLLNLWERHPVGELLDAALAESASL